MRKLVILITIVISIIFITGCTDNSNESINNDSDNTENLCYWDWESIKANFIGPINVQGGYSFEAKEDYDFIIVTLMVSNNADKSVNTNPDSWLFYADGAGYIYHPATFDESIEHETVNIEHGSSFTTKLVYEIPENTSTATMRYIGSNAPKIIFDDSLII